MSNELRTTSPMQNLAMTLTKMKDQFSSSLPANVTTERFIRTAINGIQTHKDNEKLLAADRKSLFLACQKCAQDGLVLDGREAALVTFYNNDKNISEVVYMPMVQGLVKLARNSDEIDNIFAEVVYEKDKFSYRIGIDKQCIHEPNWFAEDRGIPNGAFCTITLKNGEFINVVLNKKKIEKIAFKSKNGYQYDPEKGLHFDEWWKKTAIKNALKYAPKSQAIERAMKSDNDQEFNFSVIDEDGAEDVTPEPTTKKPVQTRAEAAILNKNKGRKPETIDQETGEVLNPDDESENPNPNADDDKADPI